jgi:hypothetical protein
MSKRNRNRRVQAASRRQELLNTPVQELMSEKIISEFMKKMADPTLSDQEVFTLQLRMQQFLSGDQSLLSRENEPAVAERLNKMREYRAKADEAERKFSEDPQRFIEDVFQQAEKKKAKTPAERDRRIATAVAKFQDARTMSRAKRSIKRLELEKALANGPKKLVHIEPEYETVSVGGQPTIQEVPIVIGIMGKRILLHPGDHMIPEIVARVYEQKKRQRQELKARENAMLNSRQRSMIEIEQDMLKIDQEFHSKRQSPSRFA